MRSTCAAGLAALVLAAALSAETVEIAELGRLDFPNSGAREAQEPFARGVLLLHSFEYEDAREAFQEARAIDPDFALAAWGEAMTHNHPLWRQQDREAALAALADLGSTPEDRLTKAPTEREKGYLEALHALYGEGDKVERDRAYEEAMGELAAAYPDDLEARAFYSLSILGTTQGVRDFRAFMRAGAVAEEVFAANPKHPGAAHYMIHSYDDPVHAPLGLRAARVYNEIAPAASHAQHMISHIFVALGRWDESVASNRKAYEVSVERAERKGLGLDQRNYHALQWLQYSHLQLGRVEQARAQLRLMREMAAESGSRRATWYYAAMRAAHVVGVGDDAAPPALPGEMRFGGRVLETFGSGLAAARSGDADGLAASATRLRQELDAAKPASDSRPTEEQLTQAEVMALELEALVHEAAGDVAGALETLGRAVELETALPLEYGPPSIAKPSPELLGEMLLRLERPSEAEAQFAKALERAPRRSLSLAGRTRAAEALGDAVLAAKTCDELRSIWARADSDQGLPSSCKVAG